MCIDNIYMDETSIGTWYTMNEESKLVTIMVIRSEPICIYIAYIGSLVICGYRYWFILKNFTNPIFIGILVKVGLKPDSHFN